MRDASVVIQCLDTLPTQRIALAYGVVRYYLPSSVVNFWEQK